MSKFSLKKYIPSAEVMRNHKSLRFLGKHLEEPNLFHFNRKSVSLAFFWGVFIGLLPPIPIHTPLAALAALIARANLPLTIVVVWIGNPFTYPIFMTAFYYLGCLILNVPAITYIDWTWQGFLHQLSQIWFPYLTGALIGGLGIATLTYFIVIYLWRANVRRRWHARERRHAKK